MIKKELVEIYTNGLEETFSVGYVLEENENFIIFKSIDEKGVLDSYQLRNKEYIVETCNHSKYFELIDNYILQSKEHGMFNPFNIENTFHLSSDLQDLITLNSMITIVMQDSIELIIGRVTEVQENIIKVKVLDFNSLEFTDVDQIYISDIVAIDLVSVENKLLENYLNA